MPGGQALLTGPPGGSGSAGGSGSTSPAATTRVVGVIGDPVRHSLSPVLHNAAFRALGLDWVYVAFAVPAGLGGRVPDAVRTLGLVGLSVTMPHKADVVTGLDQLGPVAERLGVVNTVSWATGPPELTGRPTGGPPRLRGDSTDGAGFLDAVRIDAGFDVRGRRCLVLGAGGSARAVSLALGEAGAAVVEVAARRPDPAESAAALAGDVGRAVVVSGRPGEGDLTGEGDLADAIAAADLVVNATPVGMAAGDGVPFDLPAAVWRAGQLVVDLIYSPPTTPLLAAASGAGASIVNGLDMLVRQAARQVTIWTGADAPIAPMMAAVRAALTT